MGCTAQVWATAALDPHGRVQFGGDSDSELTRGLCALLVQGLSGLTPEEVLQVRGHSCTPWVYMHTCGSGLLASGLPHVESLQVSAH